MNKMLILAISAMALVACGTNSTSASDAAVVRTACVWDRDGDSIRPVGCKTYQEAFAADAYVSATREELVRGTLTPRKELRVPRLYSGLAKLVFETDTLGSEYMTVGVAGNDTLHYVLD